MNSNNTRLLKRELTNSAWPEKTRDVYTSICSSTTDQLLLKDYVDCMHATGGKVCIDVFYDDKCGIIVLYPTEGLWYTTRDDYRSVNEAGMRDTFDNDDSFDHNPVHLDIAKDKIYFNDEFKDDVIGGIDRWIGISEWEDNNG